MRIARNLGVSLLLAAGSTLAVVPCLAAESISVRVTGATQGVIQGDNTYSSLNRANTIEGLEYHHLVTTPSGTGQAQHETVILTKRFDKATPKLWRAMNNREVLQVEFWHFRPDPSGNGTTEMYYKVILGDARIVGIEQITPSVLDSQLTTWPSIERVRFEYATLTITWVPSGGDSVTLNNGPTP